ncbi:MAG: hypothetical protein LBS45_08170 [Synergistaceae bacterium]|jgi:hypothetical protein|nr:hypothetical protein [Synergistaceae bacterium]
MKIYDSKPSFAKGELSPLLAAREDLAAYMIGAKELTNFIVLPQGGIINRPGTTLLEQGASLNDARLVPFVYSENDSYCLVFRGDYTVDVCDQSGVKKNVTGSPYGPSHLSNLRWLQSADVLYLFHHGVKPYTLKRYPGDNWQFEAVPFKSGPYLDINSDKDKKMSLLFSVLTSDWDYFTSGMVGAFVRFEFKVKASAGDFVLESTGEDDVAWSEEFKLFGASTIQSNGLWSGKVEIWRKLPDETDFTHLKTYQSVENNFNIGYNVNEDEYGTTYKLKLTGDDSGAKDVISVTWSSGGGLTLVEVRIASYVDERHVTVTYLGDSVVTRVINWTDDWTIGAFCPAFGYPALGIFHQERLILANTPNDPQTLWMSKSASWHDFGVTIPAEDTDAITVTLAAKEVNEIRGLASRSDLLIFTSGAEWAAKAGSKSDVFTPSSITLTPSGYRGSANIAPLDVGTSTLFMQKHGKVVRGMGYQLDIDGYSASELSILSEHLFEGKKAVRWAYQQEPWSVVWIVLDDGQVLALTLQQEHQVTAWARQIFSGSVRDVCAIPGETQDDLFMLVGTKLVLLNRRVDSTGFSSSTYKDEGTYTFTSAFESLELVQNANGSLQGRHKHVPGACVRVFRTCGFKIGVMTENSSILDQATFPDQLSPANKTTPYTGDVVVRTPGGAARSCRLRIENNAPQPVTVLGVFQEVGINGGQG